MGTPKHLTDPARFFLEPVQARHRQYEALRAYFVEHRPSVDVARTFGYTPGSFRVLCHHFLHNPERVFFVEPRHGPQKQPKKSRARRLIIQMRKRNLSVYDIADAQGRRLLGPRPGPRARRAHNPLLLHSGMLATPVTVPWWGGAQLTVEFP